MNKERLLKLAEVLETESRGRVLTIPGNGKVDFDMDTVVTQETGKGCGTATCAMGYAGLHPWFRKRGLRWDGLNVAYRGHNFGNSFSAAERFFDLDVNDADWLFTSKCDGETPKQVAKRIRQLIADRE